ncbi:MAG: alpha/beta hydrolase [Dehalococcoidia bacterium]
MTTATVAAEMIETRVGKVQLRRAGSGKPIVYLHSAGGEGDALPLLPELARYGEVIAPMFPGFGDSEGIEQIDGMEDAVFHLLDLFERLGLKAPPVVGLSLGGWMAAELATRYPDKLSKLVLINPAGLFIPGAHIKDIFGRTPLEMAGDLFADMSHPVAQMMLQMNKLFTEGGADAIPFDLIKPQIQAMTATARLGWNPYLHNPKLRGRLWRVAVPTLVIRGDRDSLIPSEHTKAYAEEIGGARLVTMPDVAHMVVLEKPAELADIIGEFLGA